MSRKHRLQIQQKQRRLAEGSAADAYTLALNAFKTYLQENVAVQRPQTSHVEMANLFRFGVTVHAAAVYRASALRQVRFVLADLDGNPVRDAGPYGRAINLAFSNFQNIIERCELSYCFYGEALLQRLAAPSGLLSGLRWVNNNFFQRETSPWQGLKGFRIRTVWGSDLDPDLSFLTPDQTVYLHNIDFYDDFGGIGPAQVCFVQAATESEIGLTQLQFFRNMAMPAFALQPAAGDGYRPGQNEKQELTELLRRMYQGSFNAGRSVVLPTRWETLQFQQNFEKLGMAELTTSAQSAVVRVMQVPLELMDPHQSIRTGGTQFYDTKREWLISWLMPQSERYAAEFTEQIAQPINPDWQIVPKFDRVQGILEDVKSRTENVQKQIADSVLDLYTAQKILELEPDENLRGLYLVGGIPVPSEKIRDYWRYAPGNPGMVTGGELPQPDKPQRERGLFPTPVVHSETSTYNGKTMEPEPAPKAIPFLADEAYHEWKIWQQVVARKGADYPFTAKSLPAHAVAYGRLLLATTGAAEATWNAIRIQATKSYDDTENIYRAALYNLMQDALAGNLDRKQFGIAGRDEISRAFLNAFSNGLQEQGVDPAEMTDEEHSALLDETKQERVYWTALANDMFGEVLPLKDTDAFGPARDQMLARIELWVNKGLRRVYDIAKAYASMNGMKKWTYGGTVDHCASCATAKGQVHRQRTWMKYLLPRSNQCECKGFKCDCRLEDTTERASGSLASIPLRFVGAKDEPDDESVTLPMAVAQ